MGTVSKGLHSCFSWYGRDYCPFGPFSPSSRRAHPASYSISQPPFCLAITMWPNWGQWNMNRGDVSNSCSTSLKTTLLDLVALFPQACGTQHHLGFGHARKKYLGGRWKTKKRAAWFPEWPCKVELPNKPAHPDDDMREKPASVLLKPLYFGLLFVTVN